MTWSLSAAGHHQTNDWRAEEHELLRRLADAFEADETNLTTSLVFNGNNVHATSLLDARQKLEAYDKADPAPA